MLTSAGPSVHKTNTENEMEARKISNPTKTSTLEAHINTTEVSLFDTGVGQEGIDESHVHSNTLKNLFIFRKL